MAIILIDSYTNISTSLLSFLAENYVVVVVCDKKHNPSSILLPFLQHYRFTDILKLQMECSLPLQKRLWQKIVEQKIINQAKVLSLYKKEEALKLLNFSKKVLSGDTSNMEGQAARMYWKNFFARDFKRKKENFCNFALNYGYTILRSACLRGIVARGLFPALGIHHNNKLNQFPLADDIIEPFRPVVDKYVYNLVKEKNVENQELETSDKGYLLNVVNEQVKFEGEQMTILRAVEALSSSLIDAMKNQDIKLLKLPEMII